MIITRVINGELTTIDLTKEEIFQAYREQEKVFDIQDVVEFIRDEGNMDDETYPPEFVEYMLGKADTLRSFAETLREHKDDGWIFSAIEDDLRDYLYDERTVWLKDHPEFILDDEEIKL